MGIGTDELLLILAIAFLVVGPGDLAKASRGLGKAYGQLRSLKNDFVTALDEEEKKCV
jgi:Sec-independent protein translocase protein TatA